MEHTEIDEILFEFSEKGNQNFNLNPDWLNYIYLTLPTNTEVSVFDFQRIYTKSIDDCDENNEIRKFDCIQRYLATKQETCILPWLQKYSDKDLKLCQSGTKEARNNFNISFEILKRHLNKDLEDFGCLKKNCLQTSWKPEKLFTYKDPIYVNTSKLLLTTLSDQV